MTTVHACTAGQQLVDGPSKNFRRGRTVLPIIGNELQTKSADEGRC